VSIIFDSTGDRILEYNGTDLREATAEEAAYELAKPAEKVTVLAQYSIDSKYFCCYKVIIF
jgi:hypothetical protein